MSENPYALNAGEAGSAVAIAAKTFFETGVYRPIMLHGDPGVGKTEGITHAARLTVSKLITQHVADREPTEIGGIMWESGGKMVRLAPDDFPMKDDEPTILFFDEMPQAPMMNKNLLARIILDRQIGPHRLGNKVYVCVAGNYAHNRAGTSAVPSHLNARLTHLHVVPDRERWLEWAGRNAIHPYVSTYNTMAPDDHHKPNPDHEASPNPRSWKMVHDIEMSGYPSQLRKSMIIGTVGPEVGERYIAQSVLYADMPDPNDIIKDPARTAIPTNRSTLFATMLALADKAKPANIGQIIEYTNRLKNDEEYQALCLREAKVRSPTITAAAAYTKFAMSARGQSIA